MTRYTPLWEQAGSYAASIDRHLISSVWPAAASVGCAVTAPGGTMQLSVTPGQVAVPSQNATGSTLCVSDANEPVVIAAAPSSGQNRIDLVICQPRGTDLDGGANNDFIFTAVQGVPAATPTQPATPAGSVLLATVYVGGGVAQITQANITDARPALLNPAAEIPLAAGAAFASRADLSGEVWVARGGVNGGAWRKARDVVRCRYHRTVAISFPNTAWQVIGLDTKDWDDYGLYNSTSGIATLPLPGLYRFTLCLQWAQTAANQFIQVGVWYESASPAAILQGGTVPAPFATAVTATGERKVLAAGEQYSTRGLTAPALALNIPASSFGSNYFDCAYVGTG